MSREYLELDEFSNAFDYLQKAHFYLQNQDDEFWAKWVTLSLSDSLYHFMLCVLGCGNYLKIIDFKSLKKKDKYILDSLPEIYDEDKYEEAEEIKQNYINSGNGKVFSFHKCLQRIQDNNCLPHYTFVERMNLLPCEVTNATKLRNDYRNDFQHYQNKSWRFDIESLKVCFIATISIIDKLYLSNSLHVYNDKPQYCNLKKMIDDIKNNIEEI